ncbi:hypothetical protein BC835DRAFT_1308067 [Cytidiella melzeri]|nr:hypothetical protein BC835DRAFT_1308067 [Cytidiella melzeri]
MYQLPTQKSKVILNPAKQFMIHNDNTYSLLRVDAGLAIARSSKQPQTVHEWCVKHSGNLDNAIVPDAMMKQRMKRKLLGVVLAYWLSLLMLIIPSTNSREVKVSGIKSSDQTLPSRTAEGLIPAGLKGLLMQYDGDGFEPLVMALPPEMMPRINADQLAQLWHQGHSGIPGKLLSVINRWHKGVLL